MLFIFSNSLFAVTPIARYDVVPYQRISEGETFNAGVVAFSKGGIDRVEFSISGQGYTGGSKVADEMTYNPRTGVVEYWVPLSASEFTSDGPIEIEATVYGNDGDTRDKNWIIEDSFGATYGIDLWIESEGNEHNYFCSVTSGGLFDESMLYSDIIFFPPGEEWWNGIDESIIEATSNTLTFKYGSSWGADPIALDYEPEVGDHFIISRGFGLDPLVLLVNPQGTLPRPVAYVDVSGDDGSAVVNNSDHPYATIGGAMVGLKDWMNSNGYGEQINSCIIRLNPGEHTQSNGGFWGSILSKDEWLTITSNPDLGGNKDNTTIYDGSFISTDFVRVKDLTLVSDNTYNDVFSASTAYTHKFHLWVDDCDLIGNTKFNEVSNPVSSQHLWYTNCYFTNMGKVVNEAKLARNITIEHVGDDAFVRSPLVINAYAYDIDPRDGVCEGGGCAHADCWQWWGRPVPHNMIIYGFNAINATYQGIFARTQSANVPDGFANPPVEGAAIINMQTKLIDPKDFADNAWYISVNHMLLWHNTFNEEFNFWNDGDNSGSYPLNIVNFDVRGNSFFDVELNASLGDDNGGDPDAPGVELSSWESNHFLHEAGWEFYSETPGTDVSTGDPMVDSIGRPLEGSPLIDRIYPLVTLVDADNNYRSDTADIGAFEFGSSGGIHGNSPIKLTIHPNAPNPFTEKTVIRYELSSDAHVILKIYDLTGRAVRTLVNGVKKPGVYTTEWDGRDSHGKKVPSGAYFYQIQTENGNAGSKKMIFLK